MIALSILAVVVGIVICAFGFLAAMDPEGRGGKLLLLIPVGGLSALAGVGYLGWRAFTALAGG